MLTPAIPDNERQRLRALRALEILDTPAEERFDRITRLAARLFDVPIAYISMVDENRQWLKSACGWDVRETEREVSFCGHAILEEEILVIPDARRDARFEDNPMVIDSPHVRFYAGRPLRAAGGEKVGTLCVMAPEPRALAGDEREALHELGRLAERELALTDTIRLQRRVIEAEALAHELLEIVVPMGVALSADREYERLLENTLAQARALCGADGGVLFLRDEAGALRRELLCLDALEAPLWLREESSIEEVCGCDPGNEPVVCKAARDGEPLNRAVPEDRAAAGFADLSMLESSRGYRAGSVLVQPLVGPGGQVAGVLQLTSAATASDGGSAFGEAKARALGALSTLAAAALEGYARERRLRQRIESLELKLDEAQRDRQVQKITESQFFHDLLERASTLKG